jgi:hypothetical protein
MIVVLFLSQAQISILVVGLDSLALLRLTPLSTTFISWRWALLVEETVIP